MSLKISIIASLLIIGITNFLGTNEWLTLGQLVRIYWQGPLSVRQSMQFALLKKLIEKVEKMSGTFAQSKSAAYLDILLPIVYLRNKL